MIDIRIETDPSLDGMDDMEAIKILSHLLRAERVNSGKVLIIFGNKELLKMLKNRFFNVNRTTDVIAFRLNEYEEEEIEGEIYICLQVAKENAEHYKVTYNKEITRLIIHGGLHLIGYNDSTEDEYQEMKKLEDKYLMELEY